VLEIPALSPSNPPEECIVFWLGDSFTAIPNLSKYWSANSRKSSNGGNLFNGTPGGRALKIESIDLQGEQCSGVEQIVKGPTTSGLPSDLLVLGEHRLVIFSSGKSKTQFQSSTVALTERNTIANAGNLTVGGIDQALERMDRGGGLPNKSLLFQ